MVFRSNNGIINYESEIQKFPILSVRNAVARWLRAWQNAETVWEIFLRI